MAHGAILGQSIPDLNNTYLALDGSNAMAGQLDLNNNNIVNVNTIRSTDDNRLLLRGDGISILANSSTQRCLFGHSDGGQIIAQDSTIDFLPTGHVRTCEFKPSQSILHVPLNMSKQKITGLADGTEDTDAATVGQLNAAVANVGPQYDSPTGNRHFDFCSLFVILQSNISSSTPIDPGESNCFSVAYEYIYRSPRIGDEMVLVQGGGSAFRIVYTSFGWEMSSIDQASRGEVFFIAGRVV